jgi:hypothetical protein
MLAMSLKVYTDERRRKFRNTVPSTKTVCLDSLSVTFFKKFLCLYHLMVKFVIVQLQRYHFQHTVLLNKQLYKISKGKQISLFQILEATATSKERKWEKMNTYVEAATRICWLMCIQDPPMVLYTTKKGKKFDGKYFSAYTERGNRVAFPVWPALLLCNAGPVVQKGIAQGKNKKKRNLASISPSATNNNEKAHTLELENNTLTTLDTDFQESDKHTLTRVVPYDFPGNNSTVN